MGLFLERAPAIVNGTKDPVLSLSAPSSVRFFPIEVVRSWLQEAH
jgi:hypothetical protein